MPWWLAFDPSVDVIATLVVVAWFGLWFAAGSTHRFDRAFYTIASSLLVAWAVSKALGWTR